MERAWQSEIRGEAHVAHIEKAKVLLEIEKQRINQLLNILADSSTQAALLAGCAVSAISGESIDSFDDEATGIVEKARHQFGTAVYVSAGAAALASSLWVIFISSHLIARTRDAVFQPRIGSARRILEDGVHEVRGMQSFAILTLLMTCGASAWLNMSVLNATLFCVVVLVIVWQALVTRADLDQQFEELGAGGDWKLREGKSVAQILERSLRQSFKLWNGGKPTLGRQHTAGSFQRLGEEPSASDPAAAGGAGPGGADTAAGAPHGTHPGAHLGAHPGAQHGAQHGAIRERVPGVETASTERLSQLSASAGAVYLPPHMGPQPMPPPQRR